MGGFKHLTVQPVIVTIAYNWRTQLEETRGAQRRSYTLLRHISSLGIQVPPQKVLGPSWTLQTHPKHLLRGYLDPSGIYIYIYIKLTVIGQDRW